MKVDIFVEYTLQSKEETSNKTHHRYKSCGVTGSLKSKRDPDDEVLLMKVSIKTLEEKTKRCQCKSTLLKSKTGSLKPLWDHRSRCGITEAVVPQAS